ncbi:mannose-1-phosphate guanylyltransferase [Clostridium sp.]|uniref:mannose-1-phosphate guanylyltransferase n=1 Tax=Clostridium sp. TaxID=1506 RepID=UPI002FCB5609
MLCAVIMAGGKGTRFWPLSTEEKPKQFLKLLGDNTMLQMTVKRLLPLIPMERIFIVTGKQYVDLVKKELPNLDCDNIIVEPMGRNTAPCIALSAFYINKRYKDATMLVVPSDHLIQEEEKFLNIIKTAQEFVEKKNHALVTIGITPTRPETAYGYINFAKNEEHLLNEVSIGTIGDSTDKAIANNEKINDSTGNTTDYCESAIKGAFDDYMIENHIMPVIKFVEKPNMKKAEEYLKEGNYLWNSGMFVWKIHNILKLTSEHLENTYNILKEVAITREDNYEEVLEKRYCDVDNISVDFGIMEKAENIYVIPGDLGWDDIGSWNAIERYREKDENSNILDGNIKVINGKNNIIMGNGKPIVISGLDDIFLIESDDVIIIGKKEDMPSICEIRKKADL